MSARIITSLASLAFFSLGACSSSEPIVLPDMADIPAGGFIMGAAPDADIQQGKPEHEVQVPAFRLGISPITFAQYDAFAVATERPLPQDDGLGRGQNPVVNIDRADMLAYIAWLNQADDGAGSGAGGFRLPSEAEWEYAARAGTKTAFYWGDDPDSNFANTRINDGPDTYEFISPVKTFPANPWGLYDMAGNVWEMVDDCLFPDYQGAPSDGSAWTKGDCETHVVRGGDYSSSRRGQRPSARVAAGVRTRSTSMGFRVAQDVSEAK